MEDEEAMRKLIASLSREEQKAYRPVKMMPKGKHSKSQEKKNGHSK